MDDYVKVGRIQPNLEVIQRPSGVGAAQSDYLAPKFGDQQLYLSGYGRHWGEKITYSVGLAYGSGVLLGGSFGLVKGVAKGGATRKLFVNSLLNLCGTYGPGLGNRAACITLMYCAFNSAFKLARGSIGDDTYVAPAAGFVSGALYKCKGSWPSLARHSVGAAAVFTAIDYALRNAYI
ncbi:mitochondrial inner membrane protein [Babesia caballi]|uniref:Mitochondrial inner membrane protein n=1 Tax=Babesia caballi TaxID=5871 RepID=A0AAV4LRR5_BABCB|nr:mitochondrial inner membrane protein [Babesia caballi]